MPGKPWLSSSGYLAAVRGLCLVSREGAFACRCSSAARLGALAVVQVGGEGVCLLSFLSLWAAAMCFLRSGWGVCGVAVPLHGAQVVREGGLKA